MCPAADFFKGARKSMPSTFPLRRQRPSAPASGEVQALGLVLREEFDALFRFYDAATGDRLDLPGQSEREPTPSAEECILVLELAAQEQPKVIGLEGGSYLIGLPLDGFGPLRLVAVGTVSALAKSRSDQALEQSRLGQWVRSVHSRLRRDRDSREHRQTQIGSDRQAIIAWEVVMGLDRLHRNLRIDEEPARNRARILRVAGKLLGVRALAWVSRIGDRDVLIEGEPVLSPCDCEELANHLADDTRGEESGYVLENEPRESRWGARFPGILNLMAVPVADKKMSGWVLAFNKKRAAGSDANERVHHGPTAAVHSELGPNQVLPFRRSDVAILLPFASLLGLHARTAQRYLYIKDILVGLTRSLTAAIDAKDAYTYGHSERVARAAVELGRELGLQEPEQNDIYLAGLLHDIGKIGIRDEVLTKPEPLTGDELKHIQQHPVIGHRILAGVRAISHLLPGVLYHHELWDGSGYPEGLRRDEIPLLARILAVADSFDAMNTSRPYRAALAPERVDQILRERAGIQWDPLVIAAYFRCRDRLAAIRQSGLGESLRDALDGALRNETSGSMRSAQVSSYFGCSRLI
jgi:HD-GYP domain-containing protein (c-di-GMP phosphodiesterase class II)